ncbi:MAG: methyltransferase domain-containing protein [Anaerolineales bacterium]|nr:methyltransferase domain-containing protein [Anaerolineales bacterium]
MNRPFRQFLQRTVEFPLLQRLGLREEGQDILEVGCGSGYGAVLLARLHPHGYVGIDLMPEQIALAQNRKLTNAEFLVRDAADLHCCWDGSKDVVVIFGVLHHIPAWREVITEIHRVLKPGGKLFVEEPDGRYVGTFDRFFHWGHPPAGLFRLKDFETYLSGHGFKIHRRVRTLGFGLYALEKV